SLSLILSFGTSCDENEFLIETPLDFYSANESYKTASQFDRSIVDLYGRVRTILYGTTTGSFAFFVGTDIAFNARKDASRFGNYDVELNPTSATVAFHWNNWYKVIANANTIISRLPGAAELSDEERTGIEAEARFFRGLSYHYLVHLYGGVP